MSSSNTGPHLNAVKSNGDREWFSGQPIGNDPDFIQLMDDFLPHEDFTNRWEVVKDTGASVATVADAVGGEAIISSTATTDNDGGLFQLIEENFLLATGKPLWLETRVKLSHAIESDLFFGLATTVATNPENILTTADRVGIQSDDNSNSLLCITEKNGTETNTDSGKTISNDTYVKLGFHWDGVGKVKFFVDRKLVATHTTNIVDDENVTPVCFHLSGDNLSTKTSTWDYIMVIAKR